jgi:hypothetical protein
MVRRFRILFKIWIRNRNFLKVGTGTEIKLYGSTALTNPEEGSEH